MARKTRSIRGGRGGRGPRGLTGPVSPVDPTSSDATRDKAVSNADLNTRPTQTSADGRYQKLLQIFNVKDYAAVGDGVANDYPALQSAITAANAAGGGVVWVPKGTYYLSDSGGLGGLKLAANTPISIMGAGVVETSFKLSRGCPRLFDLDPLFLANQTFKNIKLSGFTLDANNIGPTDMAPATTITAGATFTAGLAWNRISLTSNANFQGATDTVWFLDTNTGTAKGIATRARPIVGSSTDIEVLTSSALTVVTGDQITGAFSSDHALIGNRHGSVFQEAANGTALLTNFTDITLEDIDVINLVATAVAGFSVKTPSLRFGVAIYPNAAGAVVTNYNARRVRVYGGDCGQWIVGVAGTFLDEIHIDSCHHDRGSIPSTNYPSLNYMVGGDAWVGKTSVSNSTGKNSGDVGIEIDQPMLCDITDTFIEDSATCNYYVTNFHPPARSLSGPPTCTITTGGGITNVATTVTVNAVPSTIDHTGYCLIESEVCHYSVTSSTTLRLRRFFNNSANVAHAQNVTITFHEARRQLVSFTRARGRRRNSPTTRGLMTLTNSFLPLPKIRMRDCSHERIANTTIAGEAVSITGLCPSFEIDGYSVSAAGDVTTSASLFFFDSPGFLYNSTPLEVQPNLLRMKDISARVSGTGSGSVAIRFLQVNAGWWDLDIDDFRANSTLRNLTAVTSVFTSTAVANVLRGRVGIKFFNSDQADAAPIGVSIGSLSVIERLELDVDVERMFFSGSSPYANYIPWAIPSSQVGKVKIVRAVHSTALAAPYPLRPRRITTVSAAATATHNDDVIAADTVTASAGFTITLPPATGASSLALPKPGQGGELWIKDSTGAANTKNVTIAAASGETIDGASTLVLNTSYGKAHLVAVSTTAWSVI